VRATLRRLSSTVQSGVFSFYSSSGHLAAVGSYDNDVLVGEWIFYNTKPDSNGKLIYDSPTIIDYNEVHTFMTNERFIKPIPVTNPEIPPTYNGGDYRAEFKKYINDNLIYPAYPKYEGIEGQVIIQFRIDETGEVREPKVVRSSHTDFSIEALRLIINASDWEPGIQNNKAVNEVINWIIDFNLES
jgi:TonB family protein